MAVRLDVATQDLERAPTEHKEAFLRTSLFRAFPALSMGNALPEWIFPRLAKSTQLGALRQVFAMPLTDRREFVLLVELLSYKEFYSCRNQNSTTVFALSSTSV